MKPKIMYIDDTKFSNALQEYREACIVAKKDGKEEPPIPNYIGECFLKIATNFGRLGKYSRYSYLDDMIMDAVEKCLLYFRNFDPQKMSKLDPTKKVSPFSYFTQVTYHEFIRKIGKEHKQVYSKYKYAEEQGILWESLGDDPITDSHAKQWETYNNIAEFIGNYEHKEREKKAKKYKKNTDVSFAGNE